MDTLLDALQEGRLFELPDDNKADALEFLAHILEAVPEMPAGTDALAFVLKKEDETNTRIGKGWACTHVRVPIDEDLLCVIGWSPDGIAYGPDGEKVSLIVMYLVPENQRNHYLREVSTIAKALESYSGADKIGSVEDLNGIRNYMLDMIDFMKESSETSARARMIRLQAKPVSGPAAQYDVKNLVIEPVKIISGGGANIALTQNLELMKWIDGHADMAEKLESDGMYQNSLWRIMCRGSVTYQGGRIEYDCLALKI